ncbi:TorF family putative porin [Cupriavidus sp. SZY C1]|uniref:TorF family putative porin n=1 Tax=Cupriavidus sp. SZY C1 TaxID=3055037 RepID=UPI0028B4CDB3|nr:TorF family putative porin [Cupriavidus sp. SZY C1]MDT6960551.1 TorF family putative porin [Cupriavidus sp. SZY C1]
MIATRLMTSAPATLAAAILLAAPFSQAFAQQAPADAADAAAPASPHSFTANVSVVSDYRYRGISQTNLRPAVQGGFDYAHASGFYLGNWNSSISWLGDADASVSAPVEMDFYGGFRNAVRLGGQDISYDVGVLEYYYPGGYTATRPYTTEIYAGVGWGPLSLKYSHALTNLFGFADSRNSYYVDLTANVPLNVWGLTLNAHVGYQGVRHFGDASYTDWKIGVTKDLGNGFALAVAYLDTNASRTAYTNTRGRYLGKATAFASITKTF